MQARLPAADSRASATPATATSTSTSWSTPDDADEIGARTRPSGVLFEGVVALEGSISGEHGIGFAKAPFLPLELSRRRNRADEARQARVRPGRHPEPGQDLPVSIFGTIEAHPCCSNSRSSVSLPCCRCRRHNRRRTKSPRSNASCRNSRRSSPRWSAISRQSRRSCRRRRGRRGDPFVNKSIDLASGPTPRAMPPPRSRSSRSRTITARSAAGRRCRRMPQVLTDYVNTGKVQVRVRRLSDRAAPPGRVASARSRQLRRRPGQVLADARQPVHERAGTRRRAVHRAGKGARTRRSEVRQRA